MLCSLGESTNLEYGRSSKCCEPTYPTVSMTLLLEGFCVFLRMTIGATAGCAAATA